MKSSIFKVLILLPMSGWMNSAFAIPEIHVDPESADYGNVPVGTTFYVAGIFLIRNTGSGPGTLDIAEFTATGDACNDYGFSFPATPLNLSPEDSVAIDIATITASTPGPRDCTVVIHNNVVDESKKPVPFTARGILFLFEDGFE